MTKKVELMTAEEHEKTKKYGRAYQKQYRKDNPEKIAKIIAKALRKYRHKTKKGVVDAYRGGCWFIDENGVQCDKTLVNDLKDMRTHHARCDGTEQREKLFGSSRKNGMYFYKYLRDNNYPKNLGIEILCQRHHNTMHKKIRDLGIDRGDFDDPVWLREQHIDNQLSLMEIADLCACTLYTIEDRVKEFNISRG